jgi:very-short-patch-repair endonuclease
MRKLATEQFIEKAKKVHGNKYDYSLTEYNNSRNLVEIICPVHGSFWQMPHTHINRGHGCPKCSESQGEKKIRIFLESNNINYEYQKSFNKCRNKRQLYFDFYLPEYNYLIEFDGKQHYGLVEFWTDNYEDTQTNDKIKNEFARENGIYLLRIPYWEIDNIEDILKKPLK